MKFTTLNDRRFINMKILLLVIVSVLLILNLFLFHNSEFGSSIRLFVDPLFGNNSLFIYFYFPNFLAWTIFIFTYSPGFV